ncbi:Deoxynucleotidyltransferase terminal-interacting protein 2 [Toxocara canis]|uniref:Deoxynucleotidyltransferase terminal-interacting protein 2 n=1 Tax=Toxocara canis TaxID=6265 RepID=A0A0B2V229_TOXCA|nr:Deoxynucleotidyltransferase terminal-interacting protein 2 [Toxocara canis]
MRGSLFAEHSSSESETELDTDEETDCQKVSVPKPVAFQCAPKLANEKQSSVSELFVLDRSKENDSGTMEGAVENVKKKRKRKTKKSKEKNANPTIVSRQQLKNLEGGKSLVSVFHDKSLKELLAKSVVQPGFERILGEGHIPISKRGLWRQRKAERERTKGIDWFNMPATEMTEEKERDLQIIQMRDALDTKTHYKRNDRSLLPKFFQVGTIVENKADFYSARIPKKQRKRTIVEELMADEEFQRRQKKKYDEIKAIEAITKRGAFQHSTYRRRTRNKLKGS